jgi:magnesium transporter
MKHFRHTMRSVRRSAPGAPPGTVSPPEPAAVATRIDVVAYGPEMLIEEQGVDVARLAALRDPRPEDGPEAGPEAGPDRWPVLWIDVLGLADNRALHDLRALFELHPLVIEDVVNTGQRPKIEDYEDHDFIVLRIVPRDIAGHTEQLSLVLTQRCVITFQERPSGYLDPVRDRLRRGVGRLRSLGADYLAYAIVDTVIDHYVPVLEHYGERLEDLERRIIDRPHPSLARRIYEVRHEMQELQRTVLPMLDVVGRLHNGEVPRFSSGTRPYLRDCYDHVVRLEDAVDHLREATLALMELHVSSLNQRMNEVMKVLTIISTIFIPLSFVTSIYGMNFDRSSPWNMPELGWRWGYVAVLGLMLAMVTSMLIFFFRRGWLSNGGGAYRPRNDDRHEDRRGPRRGRRDEHRRRRRRRP